MKPDNTVISCFVGENHKHANSILLGRAATHLSEWPSLINQQIAGVGEDVGKREPDALWWECRLVQPLCITVWNFLTKLKTELPFDPAIALLGI